LNNIEHIESKGFRVIGRYIYKRSERTNRNKVVGQLNESNFFLYSDNAYPFNPGVNYFDNSSIVDKNYTHYIEKIKEKESNDFEVSFEQYLEVTKEKSIFSEWLNIKSKSKLNKNAFNYFDLRGVYDGYMENAVCFPFIDYNNNFVTAQIIKYDSKGKRLKNKFSTNWFHSYKNIKNNLELTEKYSVPIKCFFGENYLKGSSNIIAIVEAPKTAALLKEIYPNIDWIATAGQQALLNKNLEVLKGRKVILFPDAHTNEWSKFAALNNFYCSSILENKDVNPGDDIADYIFNLDSSVYSKLHDQLTDLNNGVIKWDDSFNTLELNFSVIGKSQSYFTIINPRYRGQNVLVSLDNAKEFKAIFKDKLFTIYEKEHVAEENNRQGYEIYTAQQDWHKPIIEKCTGFRQQNEAEFIFNLQACFRLLKAFNPKIYKEVFLLSLNTLMESNFSFNVDYIINVLVPLWDGSERDLSIFKKVRNWKFKGSKSLDRENFVKELHNSRYRCNLKLKASALYDVLEENRFIDLETDLLIKTNHNNLRTLTKLVKEWNEFVIGAKTYKSFINKEKFDIGTKKNTVHISSSICSAAKNVPKKISYSKITELTGIKNKKTIKSFLNFSPNLEVKERIKNDVFYIINKISDVQPVRQLIGSKRIIDFNIEEQPAKAVNMLKHILEPSVAFMSLDELKRTRSTNLNPGEAEALRSEIKYLELLNKIKQFPLSEKKKIDEPHLRNKLIEKHLHPMKTLALKRVV